MFDAETVRQLIFIFPIYLAEALFGCIYMEQFFTEKYNRSQTRLLFCVPCILCDCILFVFLPNTSAMYNLAWFILRPTILLLGQALLFRRREVGMHAFVTTSILAIIYIARHLISIPYVIISDLIWGNFMPWLLNNGLLDRWLATPHPNLIHQLTESINTLLFGLNAIWGFVLIFLLFHFLGKAYTHKEYPLERTDTIFLCAPCATCIVITITVNGILRNQASNKQLLLYNERPILRFWFLLIAVLLLATIYFYIILFQRELTHRQELQLASIQESQIQSLTEEITDLNRIYNDLRSLRHDLNNHIENLSGLFQSGATNDEIDDYLIRMKATTDRLTITYSTGHPVCDVILQRKETTAKEADISFTSDFSYPDNSVIDAYDLGIILDNALDNAIYAAHQAKKGFIQIHSYQNGHLYFVEVRNPFCGAVSIDPETGLPRRNNNTDPLHGLGLITIQRIADKYLGGVQVEISQHRDTFGSTNAENIFCLTIMLRMN